MSEILLTDEQKKDQEERFMKKVDGFVKKLNELIKQEKIAFRPIIKKYGLDLEFYEVEVTDDKPEEKKFKIEEVKKEDILKDNK